MYRPRSHAGSALDWSLPNVGVDRRWISNLAELRADNPGRSSRAGTPDILAEICEQDADVRAVGVTRGSR
jgi:hypothetical protein